MQLLWQMIESEVGRLPALVIFRTDATLSGRGWGWAPRSFLRSGDSVNITGYGSLNYIDDYTKDFVGNIIPGANIIPGEGLAVTLPGMVLEYVPFQGMPTHAWDVLISGNSEPAVYFYNESEGAWLRMLDWHALFGGADGGTSRQPLDHSNKAGMDFSSIVEDAPGPTILIRSEGSHENPGSLWQVTLFLSRHPPYNRGINAD